MTSPTGCALTRAGVLVAILSSITNCAESVGKNPSTPIHETILAMRGVCTSAMTEEESEPFERKLRSHGLGAVDPLITVATGSDPTGCRVIALFVLADIAREHNSLVPRLVRELAPLAEDRDLQQLVVQVFSGFGEAANDDLIAHLRAPQPDRRRVAFVALAWINKQRIADRPDLRDFDLDAPDREWQGLANRWEAWWSTGKGTTPSKP